MHGRISVSGIPILMVALPMLVRAAPSPNWPIPATPGAERIFYEDYESGECARIGDNTATAVVDKSQGADVKSGSKCMRGNYYPGAKDPITGKQRIGDYGRYAHVDNVGIGKLGAVREFYFSCWWRLDANTVNNEGNFPPDSKGMQGAYKFGRFRGNKTWQDPYFDCVIAQHGSPKKWKIGSSSGAAPLAASQAGKWHRVEFYAKLNSRPGVSDGIRILRVDGQTVINTKQACYISSDKPQQELGSMQLPSMYGGPNNPASSFGWQLDEFEIWDGLPGDSPEPAIRTVFRQRTGMNGSTDEWISGVFDIFGRRIAGNAAKSNTIVIQSVAGQMTKQVGVARRGF